MEELVMQALNEAKIKLEELVPQTKKETRSISIIDVPPLKLSRFMEDNNIPDSAYFDGRDNGYSEFKMIDIVNRYCKNQSLVRDYVEACEFAVHWHKTLRVAINSNKRDFDWEDHAFEEYKKYMNKEQEILGNILKYMLEQEDAEAARKMVDELYQIQY